MLRYLEKHHPSRPHNFLVPGWRFPVPLEQQCSVAPVVIQLLTYGNGFLPESIRGLPQAAEVFAAAANIPLCPADIEPALIFPHHVYMSRAQLADVYDQFVAWGLATKWFEQIPDVAGQFVETPIHTKRLETPDPVRIEEAKKEAEAKAAAEAIAQYQNTTPQGEADLPPEMQNLPTGAPEPEPAKKSAPKKKAAPKKTEPTEPVA